MMIHWFRNQARNTLGVRNHLKPNKVIIFGIAHALLGMISLPCFVASAFVMGVLLLENRALSDPVLLLTSIAGSLGIGYLLLLEIFVFLEFISFVRTLRIES